MAAESDRADLRTADPAFGSVEGRARLLIQVDAGSGEPALRPEVVRFATALNAEVVLIQVVQPPSATVVQQLTELNQSPGDLLPAADLLEWQAWRTLRRLEPAFGSLPVRSVVLFGENPEREISRWLRDQPADYVVLSEQPARGWLPRWAKALLGTVTGRPRTLALAGQGC